MADTSGESLSRSASPPVRVAKRTRLITLSWTDEEWARISARADKGGVPPAVFARQLALERLDEVETMDRLRASVAHLHLQEATA